MQALMLKQLFLISCYLLPVALSTFELPAIEITENLAHLKVYTVDELSKHDGSDTNSPLLMSVRGVVFDVSEGKGFYGKGKSYNALIGKDSSRAVAKMSLEPEDLTHDLSGLSENYLKSLQHIYESVYLAKYPVVGIMDYLKKSSQSAAHRDL